MCKDSGAENLYLSIRNAMWLERMSEERKQLCSVRAMVVIYMLYSHSQKCNSFQVALSRTLQQFRISNKGLESFTNLSVAAHPRTVKIFTKSSSSSHNSHVFTFIKTALENNQFLIFCIDDFHNIHTHHRPETKMQTQTIHMATLLIFCIDDFHNIHTHHRLETKMQTQTIHMATLQIEAVVSQHGNNVLPTPPVKIQDVKICVSNNLYRNFAF